MLLGVVVSALAALFLVALCSGPGPLAVSAPTGPGAGCLRLHIALPATVDGGQTRSVDPSSPRTAAWGNPAVVLRCGVARPAGLTPTSEVIEVEGIEWFLVERPETYVFTAVGRRTYVQVVVPGSTPRTEAVNALVDLAPAVRRVPAGP